MSWIQLERVNSKPFSTQSAQESEWNKAYVVLNYWLLVFEKINLIRVKLFERMFIPTNV